MVLPKTQTIELIMKLNQFAKMRGMSFAYKRNNPHLIDSILNSPGGDEIRENLKLKRIQFDSAPQLATALENICSLLECSKREFLEMALWDAIDKAQAEFEDSFKDACGLDFGDVFGVKEGE